ncbi:MAG: PH domain-containing protein [Chloroflexi bacterium]|nr:PH domain-containing protein [Chloroflexota bacterium]MCI0576488.1 PH domain-containing protein [Chloroflexota bacterium]MCI0649536.1 PH domain-containing protein [Chloroflexota bacterium]MCI0729388.1 PH domain-containing protein [Chloroflexota bacterium]
MTINEARNRVKARIWQAIAQGNINLSALPKAELEALIDVAADAALLEVDDEMGQIVSNTQGRSTGLPEKGEEKILWQGRPFLSVSKEYIITNERVRVIEGLLGKEREDIELIRVQDIDQSQTLRERMLNLGDITIRSHDTSHPELVLNNVKDPQTVHEILRRAVMEARQKYRLSYREEM